MARGDIDDYGANWRNGSTRQELHDRKIYWWTEDKVLKDDLHAVTRKEVRVAGTVLTIYLKQNSTRLYINNIKHTIRHKTENNEVYKHKNCEKAQQLSLTLYNGGNL